MAALVAPYLGPCYSAKGVFPDVALLQQTDTAQREDHSVVPMNWAMSTFFWPGSATGAGRVKPAALSRVCTGSSET
jgi:hypothetical protein